jgi:DNA modification methylase
MKLIHGDCIEKMRDIPDNSIDMVMTSPPYDNLRDYGKDFTGWGEHIWKPVLDGVFRVLKDGGVCVWVVGDATINGSETGTSFKQALYWMEIGGKLHDTMIYHKNNPVPNEIGKRYQPSFEYMFVLTKGKIKTFNPILEKAKMFGHVKPQKNGKQFRQKDGTVNASNSLKYNKEYKFRHNIFNYNLSERSQHPATFPLKLATDHIISWSNESDTILDPFMGSGTTGVACVNLNRDFIGIELDEGYFKIAEDRIHEYQSQGGLF